MSVIYLDNHPDKATNCEEHQSHLPPVFIERRQKSLQIWALNFNMPSGVITKHVLVKMLLWRSFNWLLKTGNCFQESRWLPPNSFTERHHAFFLLLQVYFFHSALIYTQKKSYSGSKSMIKHVILWDFLTTVVVIWNSVNDCCPQALWTVPV